MLETLILLLVIALVWGAFYAHAHLICPTCGRYIAHKPRCPFCREYR